MILDFVQAKRVHGLRKPCEEYCSELIAMPETRFAEDSSEPLLLFSEWLKKKNPALLPDWYWLCRLTTKNETNRDRGLIELLALALVMEDRTAEKTEALSSFAMESHTGCGCLRLNKLSHRLSAMQMNSNILWNLQSLPCICLWEQNDIR